MSDITRMLSRVQERDPKAAEELLPLVYEELRRLAASKMAHQPPGQTLQATALVHEAWLKLPGNSNASWRDRQHFFRTAAEAMRQIAEGFRGGCGPAAASGWRNATRTGTHRLGF